MRVSVIGILLGIFYGMPWVYWEGNPVLLFDLPARKFHLFGLILFPQDFIYLTLLLIIAALTLFFVTALAGRLWCGYACPQTAWTEVFLWMERKIEGDRLQQMKLDKSPWNARKIRIKGTKHLVWIVFSAWTGFTFVGFFTPIMDLGQRLLVFELGPWETFWVAFYGFATYGNAGWLREQLCIYMCPYARFQGAMFDKDTLIIAYDGNRGEPRGSRKRGTDHGAQGLGDCIDCTLCVQVCPTGIDIRKGLQYECIACAACIDACDDVMDRMGYAKGLVRYATEHAMEGKPVSVLRPRVLIYGVVLIALLASVIVSLINRVPVDLDVIRDRNTLYRETGDGRVENVYTLKISNMDGEEHAFRVAIDGPEGMELVVTHSPVQVGPGEVVSLTVRANVDPAALTRTSTEISFRLESVDDPGLKTEEPARFLGPPPHR
ncbi:MAG: cytochrome c oxidase accessory protein CcoG [Gammaproteobacteria bacterium]|nr:MAG: cytochrome c oxidase accessory protein CcoG [Gammaproteobacteria bacterium]